MAINVQSNLVESRDVVVVNYHKPNIVESKSNILVMLLKNSTVFELSGAN